MVIKRLCLFLDLPFCAGVTLTKLEFLVIWTFLPPPPVLKRVALGYSSYICCECWPSGFIISRVFSTLIIFLRSLLEELLLLINPS